VAGDAVVGPCGSPFVLVALGLAAPAEALAVVPPASGAALVGALVGALPTAPLPLHAVTATTQPTATAHASLRERR
jgi:hypothetical protein